MDMAPDDINAPGGGAPDEASAAVDAARAVEARGEFNTNDFVAMVSHDLREPLRAMTGLATRIRDGAHSDGPDVLRSWADALLASTNDLDQLIRDLCADTLDDDGALRMSPAPLDVAALVVYVADAFVPLAGAKSITLSRDIDGPLPATCDATRLLQVLCNLVDNAIHFTPPGGCVRIRAARQGPDCVVAVVDTGVGIPKAALKSVFSPVHTHRPNQQPTWCLGLNSSRGIVEAHDGRIWAEGETGAGSTFYVTLPLDAADALD
jgi:chemotaxis family two-component system sensor kinase Cph1